MWAGWCGHYFGLAPEDMIDVGLTRFVALYDSLPD